MSRTMAREMYLATLDENLFNNTTKHIGENNIMLVTARDNKESIYKDSPYILSFKDMLEELKTELLSWGNFTYSEDEL